MLEQASKPPHSRAAPPQVAYQYEDKLKLELQQRPQSFHRR